MSSLFRAFLPAAGLAAAIAMPASAWDDPGAVAGAYRLGPPGAPAEETCEMELLAPIAYEFEGVWYVARPFHYEDNREACRRLGVADVVAWSGLEGGALWLLAEGEAGFMEFAADGDGAWRLAKSGHAARPDLVLARMKDGGIAD